ncbi:MAG: ABC transporter permease [Egibacteraceae bacterium]
MARSARGSLIVLVALAVWWEALARSGLFEPLFMPSLVEIGSALVVMSRDGTLWQATGATLRRLAIGLGLGSGVGILLGFAMGRLRLSGELLIPLTNFLLPLPAIALIPLFMLWFGLGDSSIIPLVAFSSALPIALNTWSGINTTDPLLLRAARSMNVRGAKLFFKVILPSALPLVITGLRIGFAQGWRAVIAGELIASAAAGLGFVIFNARQFVNLSRMMAALLVIGVLSQIFEKLVFSRLETATVVRWGMLRGGVTG